jgi:HPt (histidine-containing phosphotransfer) domain-containing protein
MVIDYELNELKREFLSEAAGKVREIQSALEGKYNGESLERLAYLAHQLKGSGGSYGYQRISQHAAEIEHAAERLSEGAGGDGLEENIRKNVTSLQAEIDQRVVELGPASS